MIRGVAIPQQKQVLLQLLQGHAAPLRHARGGARQRGARRLQGVWLRGLERRARHVAQGYVAFRLAPAALLRARTRARNSSTSRTPRWYDSATMYTSMRLQVDSTAASST